MEERHHSRVVSPFLFFCLHILFLSFFICPSACTQLKPIDPFDDDNDTNLIRMTATNPDDPLKNPIKSVSSNIITSDSEYALVSGSNSSSGSGSSSSSGSGSGPNSGFCSELKSCESCASSSKCVWCAGQNNCVDGDMFGGNVKNCSSWRWKQCHVPGVWLLVAGAGGVALIFFIIVTVVCCCLRSRPCFGGSSYVKTPEQARQEVQLLEETRTLLNGGSRTPMTDEHRQRMKEKWGVGGTKNDENRKL